MATVEVPEYDVEDIVDIEPERTALIVVDMQNDFVREGGALPVKEARKTVSRVRNLCDAFRARSMLVVYTQDSHGEGDREFAIWGRHVVEGTFGEEIVSELTPHEGDVVVKKPRYDAFYGTDLDHRLRMKGIDTVVVVGTVANICVHYTTASAALRWYRVICPIDCISALTEFDMHLHLRQTAYLFQGILTTSDALVRSLARVPSSENPRSS